MQLFEKRPPFVQFEQREHGINREESDKAGIPIPRLVDFALITPSGSKDVVEKIAPEWILQIKKQAMDGNYPPDWLQYFELRYSEWKKGNELPESGTPIKTWIAVTKGQAEQIIRANIRTIEDLAVANEQALSHIGMGGRYYKDLAIAYLDEAKQSVNAVKIANLEGENRDLRDNLERMQNKLEELENAIGGKKKVA